MDRSRACFSVLISNFGSRVPLAFLRFDSGKTRNLNKLELKLNTKIECNALQANDLHTPQVPNLNTLHKVEGHCVHHARAPAQNAGM